MCYFFLECLCLKKNTSQDFPDGPEIKRLHLHCRGHSFDPGLGGSWDILNVDSEPGKPKWLAKGNLEEMPHKSNSNYHKGAPQWLCLSKSVHVSTHMYSFPPNKHLFHYFWSLREFFFCKSKRPGPCLTTALVSGIQGSSHCDPISVSGEDLKRCFKLLHTAAPWDQTHTHSCFASKEYLVFRLKHLRRWIQGEHGCCWNLMWINRELKKSSKRWR